MDEESPSPTSIYHSLLPSQMSSHSEPSIVTETSVATFISLSVVSAPENTPTDCPLTPQLAIWSEPILDNDNDSLVNYARSVLEEDEDTAPTGYLINDPTSCHFYPIYLNNPSFGIECSQPRMILAKFLKYSTDYQYAYGMLKKGGEVCNTPVQVGRRAHSYMHMMEAQWRDLMRGNEKEFAINKALLEMGDLRLLGEINTFRRHVELKKTLEDMLKDAHGRVHEVMRELLKMAMELEELKKRLELSNAYQEINDKFHSIFGLRPRPRQVLRSPDILPFTPTLHGPLKMPLLHDKDRYRTKRCFRCKEVGHMVQQCTKTKVNKPRRQRNQRSVRGVEAQPVEIQMFEEHTIQTSPVLSNREMTLLEHIELFDHTEWTPEVCNICGKINTKHSNLECPLYEKCDWCKGTGAYGYRRDHTCYAPKGLEEDSTDHNECNYDLYWSGKD